MLFAIKYIVVGMIGAALLHLLGLGGIAAVNFLCCAAIALVSALCFRSEPNVELEPADPLLRQIYRRYKVDVWEQSTDWSAFENELGHYMLTGDTNPVLHVDSSKDYRYSIDQCQHHKHPHCITFQPVIYNKKSHTACAGCGLILSIPQTRLPNAR